MMDPDHPEFARALQEASIRVEAIRGELLEAYPVLRGSLAIPGMMIGHALGVFVANGMTDDQIIVQVLAITAQIRGTLDKIQSSA